MKHIFVTAFIVLLHPTLLYAQTITDMKANEVNGRVEISYTLKGASTGKYNIFVSARDAEGNLVIPASLFGDITEVVPGAGKHIWWEPQLEGRPATGWKISLKAEFSLGITWIFVEGGTFQMGSNEGGSDERPVHMVTVSSFAISQTEVTFEQYDRFCDATGREKPSDEGWGRGNRPVINVSWHDAVAYCEWASSVTGKKIRLPYEAEWEYAARGGNKSQGYKFSGSNDLNAVGWYDSNSGGKSQPVGQKQANELGIYDMSGNVWEWCQDWYDANYYKNSPALNPKGPSSGSNRVLRGGTWAYYVNVCRVASRVRYFPVNRYYSVGFRALEER